MSYKSFKGKWPVTGDKPVISILTTGLICFNKACYDSFIKPTNCKYLKLYYDPDAKKIAFEPINREVGAAVFPVKLVKPCLFGIVSGKTFLNACGIKYQAQVRSYPVHETIIRDSGLGYQGTRKGVKGIEIKLTEYFPANS
ncbi:MAG: hypothetical protein AAB038_04230 [Planctomycetota bacterium]